MIKTILSFATITSIAFASSGDDLKTHKVVVGPMASITKAAAVKKTLGAYGSYIEVKCKEGTTKGTKTTDGGTVLIGTCEKKDRVVHIIVPGFVNHTSAQDFIDLKHLSNAKISS